MQRLYVCGLCMQHTRLLLVRYPPMHVDSASTLASCWIASSVVMRAGCCSMALFLGRHASWTLDALL